MYSVIPREITINNEGMIHINGALKEQALLISVYRQLRNYSSLLEQEIMACPTTACLGKAYQKLRRYQQGKEHLSTLITRYYYSRNFNYLQCNKLVMYNDIKICRRKVKEEHFYKLYHTIKNNRIRTSS